MRILSGRGHHNAALTAASLETRASAVLAGTASDAQEQKDRMLDAVMMRLRTADGLCLMELESSYGSSAARSIASALEPHRQAGLVQACSDSSSGAKTGAEDSSRVGLGGAATANGHAGPAGRSKHVSMQQSSETGQGGPPGAEESLAGKQIRLSDPEGFLVSNDIISDVFVALE